MRVRGMVLTGLLAGVSLMAATEGAPPRLGAVGTGTADSPPLSPPSSAPVRLRLAPPEVASIFGLSCQ
jgi:hypothetical protein